MEDHQSMDSSSVSPPKRQRADDSEQAIQDLRIDFRAIEDVSKLLLTRTDMQTGRFALWSCTKESLRAWDGLLSVDWIGGSRTGELS